MPKLCKDCVHYIKEGSAEKDKCSSINAFSFNTPPVIRLCVLARRTRCGFDASLFKTRVELEAELEARKKKEAETLRLIR